MDIGPSRVRIVQNFHLVWLDGSIDEMHDDDCRNAIIKLRQVINTVNTFTDVDECIDFIRSIKKEKTFMISSGSLGHTTVPLVHDMAQVRAIYIFCGNKALHEQLATQWLKVKGVFTDIAPICEALKQAAQECDQNSISLGFVTPSSGNYAQNLDQLDQSFMYTQVLKEVLLTTDFEQKHFVEFITYCREQLVGNDGELENVDKLEWEYRAHVPIWWYTYHLFLYSMLNRALRIMEVDLIIKIGFFVRDLHQQITHLHSEQYADQQHSPLLTVYRGQGVSPTDFDKFVKIKGGLMYFNNFLSTSLDRDVSLAFAESSQNNPDLIGLLFQITIDLSIPSTPFANIRDVSYYQEEKEILFSIHSIFRIGHIKQIDNNPRLWQIDLTLTSDNDPQLNALNESIREETGGSTGWHRLGQLMIKTGQFNKAEELYEILLDRTTDEGGIAIIYYQLGLIKYNQGEYPDAVALYEKSLEISKKILPPNHPDLAKSYNNIGSVYESMEDYSKAFSFFERSADIRQRSLPANHPDVLATRRSIERVEKKL